MTSLKFIKGSLEIWHTLPLNDKLLALAGYVGVWNLNTSVCLLEGGAGVPPLYLGLWSILRRLPLLPQDVCFREGSSKELCSGLGISASLTGTNDNFKSNQYYNYLNSWAYKPLL